MIKLFAVFMAAVAFFAASFDAETWVASVTLFLIGTVCFLWFGSLAENQHYHNKGKE